MIPTTATVWARAIAAYGLDTRLTLDGRHIEHDHFLPLLMECQRHRLVGLLAQAVDDGAVTVDAEALDQLVEVVRSWQSNEVRIEQLLLQVADLFKAAEIDHRVLKGAAVAHTVYNDPGQRSFGDLDILVPSEDFGRAAGLAINDLKGHRVLPELRPGFDDRFGREILVKVGDLELDLHRRLVDGYFGHRIPLYELFGEPSWFQLAGQALPTLDPSMQFVHACYSAVLGNATPRLMSQRDVQQMLNHDEFLPEKALDVADLWGVSAVVHQAIIESSMALAVDAQDLSGTARPDNFALFRARVIITAYRNRFSGKLAHASALLNVGGPISTVAYGRAIVRPQASFRRARRAMHS